MKKLVLIRSIILGLISFFYVGLSAQLTPIPNQYLGPPSCTYSLDFDGETNYLPLTSGVVPESEMTVAAWVKPDATTAGTVLHWGPTSGCSPSAQVLLIRNDRLELTTGCGTAIRGGTTLSAGTWYHLAVTINSSGVTTLYVNGVQDGAGNGRTGTGSTVSNGESTVGVGYSNDNLVNYFEGAMSEFSIWSKVLSSTEITTLMSSSPLGSETDLIKYYPFNEGAGSTITNQSTRKSFNGTSSYVAIPNVVPSDDFSVVMEVTPTSSSATGALFYQGPRTGCNPSAQSLTIENGKVRAATGCGGTMSILSTTSLNAGNTYKVAYTVSNIGIAKIYINGVLENTGNTRNGNTVTTGNAEIGRIFSANTPSKYYDGIIKEVSIWDAELNSTELNTIQTNGLNGSESNLLALYDLSKIENGTIEDKSLNINDASAFNLEFESENVLKLGGVPNNFNGGTVFTPSTGQTSTTNFSYMFTFTPFDVTEGTFFYYGPKTGCNPSGQSLILVNGKVRFLTGCGGSSYIQSNTTLIRGQEYHIALLMNSAGVASLYIDGVFESSGDTRNGNTVSTGNNIIGARYSGNTLIGYLNGVLSEISYWDVTLSGSGVSSLMTNGLTGSEQGLKAWYTLDDYLGGGTVLDKTLNGNNATATGLYLIDDSSVWSLTSTTLNTNVIVSGNDVSAELFNATTYQWLDCDNGNVPINGETSNTFVATQTGNYGVEISQGICVDTSMCEMVVVTALDDDLTQGQLVVYPNPATDFINTEVGFVHIYNQLGTLVLSKKSDGRLDVSSLENGVYLLMIESKRSKLIIE